MTETKEIDEALSELAYIIGVVANKGSENVPLRALPNYIQCQSRMFNRIDDRCASYMKVAANDVKSDSIYYAIGTLSQVAAILVRIRDNV